MQVPFLDLKAQYNSIRKEVNAAIQEVLDNTAYVLGKAVFDFEDRFAKAHKVKHCIGTSFRNGCKSPCPLGFRSWTG